MLFCFSESKVADTNSKTLREYNLKIDIYQLIDYESIKTMLKTYEFIQS